MEEVPHRKSGRSHAVFDYAVLAKGKSGSTNDKQGSLDNNGKTKPKSKCKASMPRKLNMSKIVS